jgi:hypothetical protein
MHEAFYSYEQRQVKMAYSVLRWGNRNNLIV